MLTNTHVTCPSNESTHPGVPDIDEEVMSSRSVPKPRRTKAQITADNIATAKKKSMKAEETKLNSEKKAEIVVWIATLEKRMLDDKEQAKKEAARPPVKKRTIIIKSPIKCMNLSFFNCVMC